MTTVAVRLDATGDLDRVLESAQERAGFAVVFAGRVQSGTLRISNLRGNRSEALRGLSLPPGVGLGGRATTLGRPVSVRDYSCALAITHEYDSAVAREGLRALVAVPARVHGRVSAVLYGGIRSAMSIGDRAIADLVAAGRQLSRDLEAAPAGAAAPQTGDEPIHGERDEMPGRAHWCAVVAGIVADLAAMPDRPVRAEARNTCLELLDALSGDADPAAPPVVRPSDLKVLELAALGCTDREIAQHIGIELHAVRRRMRMLRKTFGVHSRHAAVSAARVAGVLS
ncbi:GAF domain-containing protein [Prescottella agglutinans]|uniref:GAF domain-containing protein n=1 Tax=Prescottella agglutinans TaxID=1644129 RepID=UPI003D98A9C6